MTIELKVPDMACNACVKTIIEAIHSLDSQAIIQADTKQITIETQASVSSLKEAIAAAGYSPA